MAEIIQSNNKRKRGVRRGKKLSTRVDLTPMVDLGFLLITFFVFTSAVSEPMAMNLNVPKDSKDSMKTAMNKTISIITGNNDSVWFYNGDDPKAMQLTNFSSNGLRDVLLKKKMQMNSYGYKPDDLVVLIKTMDSSSYGSLVKVLDEMLINNVSTYVLTEPSENEKKILNK